MALLPRNEEPRKAAALTLFDEWALTYDATIKAEFEALSGISYEEYMAQLLAVFEVPPGGRILDIATGTGLVAIALAHKMGKRCQIMALDMTPGMLDQARQNLERAGMSEVITLRQGLAEKLPCDDCSFDVVNCSLAIHHTKVSQSLAEMTRVLKPGGQLVISDFVAPPTWETLMGRIAVPLYRFVKRFAGSKKEKADTGYAVIYPRRQWAQLLSANRLEMKGFQPYPKEGEKQWAPLPFILVARKKSD